MATPRRFTRSQSRESTPGPVGAVPSRTRRSNSQRPAVPVQQSFAYGSPGKESTPSELNDLHADQDAANAIAQGVKTAQTRPTPVPGIQTEGELDGYALPAIEEEEDDHPQVEPFYGQGNISPVVNGGNLTSFGTEQPVGYIGGGESSRNGEVAMNGPGHQTRRPKRSNASSGSRSEVSQNEPQQAGEARLAHRALKWLQVFANSGRKLGALLRDEVWPLLFWIIALLGLGMLALLAITTAWRTLRGMPTQSSLQPSGEFNQSVDPLVTLSQYNHLMDRIGDIEHGYKSIHLPIRYPIIHRVNYFSVGLGAMIDPHLTSPTNRHTYKTRAWHHWGYQDHSLTVPQPADALTRWEDLGDCWCAAPSRAGMAQITVLLPKKVAPTELVVEHIDHDATLDIGAAPHHLELWVQIEDPEKREIVAMAAEGVISETFCKPQAGQQGCPTGDYGVKEALDATWVRIGAWEYNIYTGKNVQSLPVQVALDHFKVPIEKASIRVRSNWGTRDYTCLYRLKLHGLLARDETELELETLQESLNVDFEERTKSILEAAEERRNLYLEEVAKTRFWWWSWADTIGRWVGRAATLGAFRVLQGYIVHGANAA